MNKNSYKMCILFYNLFWRRVADFIHLSAVNASEEFDLIHAVWNKSYSLDNATHDHFLLCREWEGEREREGGEEIESRKKYKNQQ